VKNISVTVFVLNIIVPDFPIQIMKKYPDQHDVDYVVGEVGPTYDLISSLEYDRSFDILSAKSSLSLSILPKLAPMLTLALFSTPSVIGTATVILFSSLGAETLTTLAKAAQIVAQLYSSHFSSPENDLGERCTLLPDHSTVQECIFLIENLKMVPRC
jgi:hypothetical protein